MSRKVVKEAEAARIPQELAVAAPPPAGGTDSTAGKGGALDTFNLHAAPVASVAGGRKLVTERDDIRITDADRSSPVQTQIESDRAFDRFDSFIEENRKGGDEPSLGNEPDEPGPKGRRDVNETGIFDATDAFGEAPSEKEQMGKALGLSDEEIAALPGNGTPDGRDGGKPGGLWGLGGGGATDTSAWTGISNERDQSYGSEMIQDGGMSGAAPVGYDKDEGVRSGDGMKELAEKYKGAPSFSPDQMRGGQGDAMRQAMIAVDELGSEKHVSKDGKVESLKMSDGTVIVSNKENGTTTVMKPDGSTTTTDSSGKVVDRSNPNKAASQPNEDAPVELPDGIIDLHSGSRAALRPYVGSGDVDPVEEGEVTTSGTPERRDPVGLFGQPATESGFDRVKRETPEMPGMPGDVDPNEDDSWSSGQGPEDDPLAGMNSPTLENTLSQPEEDEEEQDDVADDE